MNPVIENIKSRRSIRKYKPDPLQDSELGAILEAATYAPSAHNEQSWHYTVVRNKKLIDRMSAKSKEIMALQDSDWIKNLGKNKEFHIFHNAPVVVVVSMKKDAISPLVDCSAGIENMLLAAESLDIGSCWIGLARYWFAMEGELPRLQLPEGYEPCYAVALGYKAQRPSHALPRKEGVINYID